MIKFAQIKKNKKNKLLSIKLHLYFAEFSKYLKTSKEDNIKFTKYYKIILNF